MVSQTVRQYRLARFCPPSESLAGLELVEIERPPLGPSEVRIAPHAWSLNFRDLLVIRGWYNPQLELPAVPLSDGAGEVIEVGSDVDRVAVGDRVVSHFVADWIDGPYRGDYLGSTLGTPGAGLAADEVVLPAHAVLPIPDSLSYEEAATLPIAGLTAWSALVTEGNLASGNTVLTLGTGGVSIFALQLATAMGARVIVTSKSDEKLERCRALGAFGTINYAERTDWDQAALELTDGAGVDVVVENGGVGTLSQSLRAVRPGGTVAMLGALTGLQGEVDIAPILMKRVRVAGVLVDSRASFEALNRFLGQHQLRPVIGTRHPFEALPDALEEMAAGAHFGKIVLARS